MTDDNLMLDFHLHEHSKLSRSKDDLRYLLLGMAGGAIIIIIEKWIELAYNSFVHGNFDLPFFSSLVVLVSAVIAVFLIYLATGNHGSGTQRTKNRERAESLLEELNQIEKQQHETKLKLAEKQKSPGRRIKIGGKPHSEAESKTPTKQKLPRRKLKIKGNNS